MTNRSIPNMTGLDWAALYISQEIDRERFELSKLEQREESAGPTIFANRRTQGRIEGLERAARIIKREQEREQ